MNENSGLQKSLMQEYFHCIFHEAASKHYGYSESLKKNKIMIYVDMERYNILIQINEIETMCLVRQVEWNVTDWIWKTSNELL